MLGCNGQIVQALVSGSLNELSNEDRSKPTVPTLGYDVDTLDGSRESRPLLGPGDSLDHREPGHANGSSVHLDQEGQMRFVVCGHPVAEVGSEAVRVSLLASFDCTPDPTQSCQISCIGDAGLARRRRTLGAGRSHAPALHQSPLGPLARQPESPSVRACVAVLSPAARTRLRRSHTLGLRWPKDDGPDGCGL